MKELAEIIYKKILHIQDVGIFNYQEVISVVYFPERCIVISETTNPIVLTPKDVNISIRMISKQVLYISIDKFTFKFTTHLLKEVPEEIIILELDKRCCEMLNMLN